MKIDGIDKKIIRSLIKDARIPILSIARDVGISGAAIHQRLKKLEKSELIDGYQMIINPKSLGYNTTAFVGVYLNSLAVLNEEKEKIEAITNRTLRRSMNNEYLVSLPHNYRNLIELEIATDFTMVYENVIGFRASTCSPFLFYDLDYEIVTPLKIHPISLTTKGLNKTSTSKKTETIQKMMESVKKVNGTFSMIFDNYNFMNSKKNSVLKTIFSEINK